MVNQKTRVCHALEALTRQPVVSPAARQRLKQTKRWLDEKLQAVEAERLALLEQRFAPEMALLCSIPGIGRKTAGRLLLFAGGFARLDNHRQLIAKAGLSPRKHSSGASIRGKARITQMGGGLIRGKLFLCRFSAGKSNAACKTRYDRLVTKGKNGLVALITVCNKLLKQAFAIIKSGVPYQADFRSTRALSL